MLYTSTWGVIDETLLRADLWQKFFEWLLSVVTVTHEKNSASKKKWRSFLHLFGSLLIVGRYDSQLTCRKKSNRGPFKPSRTGQENGTVQGKLLTVLASPSGSCWPEKWFSSSTWPTETPPWRVWKSLQRRARNAIAAWQMCVYTFYLETTCVRYTKLKPTFIGERHCYNCWSMWFRNLIDGFLSKGGN